MRHLLTFLLLFFASLSWSQSQQLNDFNTQRLKKQQTAMLVLGAWAVGNIGTGLALRGNATGATRHFYEMNAGWNAINLAIAGLGYWTSLKTDPSNYDLASTIDEQYKIQKILLFNAGLDVGYMLGGAYLIERSKRTKNRPVRLKGFGQSIVLQGGFLMAFDIAVYLIHAKGNKTIPALLEGLSFSGDAVGLNIQF